jgi:hypothetical protein
MVMAIALQVEMETYSIVQAQMMRSEFQACRDNGGRGTTGKVRKLPMSFHSSQVEIYANIHPTGRHAILVKPDKQGKYLTPPPTNTLRAILKGIVRMFTCFPIWDVSYLVAVIFTLGSVVWCINAFFVWLPLEKPSTEFSGDIADAGGITAFIGATIVCLFPHSLMWE